ncbi:fumarylacetoacetate hydrolase family protein [Dongia sp.]|uniref:fumarylacetoacetate hydrolase family protein n=1 Tax=Dongia sp. TaxID=1977262 RepID=UPI0035B21F74
MSASYMFTPAPIPVLPISGTDALFPVHRIYCVGRNYADHAIEMGHDPNREAPFFFQKNPDSLILPGADFPYPTATRDVHHEIELVVALHSGGVGIAPQEALGRVFGYAVGLDMTRRDLQAEAKKAGRPWEVAKAFDHAAPCSAIQPAERIGHPQAGAIWLKVNGETRQQGDLGQMIWKIGEMISYLSNLFTLRAGDLIFTGTPAGVGPVERGQHLQGGVDGVGTLDLRVI